MAKRRIYRIVGFIAIALSAQVAKPAAGADPPSYAPQTLWADSSLSGPAADPAVGAQPAADSPQGLWTNFAQSSTATNAPSGASAPQPLWADSAAATDVPPTASTAPPQSPSQTFWSSVNRGYQTITPWAPKEYPGFPGWGPAVPFQPTESAFYTRLDYFHWSERFHGSTILDERGPLYTVGYTRTGGEQRLRVELFAGVEQYQGETFGGGQTYQANNRATYYGGRIEYDLFFNLPNHPNGLLFLGLGTRVWHRGIPNATLPGNITALGYNDTWVTVYPYLGLETRHDPTKTLEFYGRMRVGVTAYTHNHHIVNDDPQDSAGLAPQIGATALLEEGVRYHNFTVTGWAEVFGFSRSDVNNGQLQPVSTLLTLGVKAGYSF
jgi:hypothetical protein